MARTQRADGGAGTVLARHGATAPTPDRCAAVFFFVSVKLPVSCFNQPACGVLQGGAGRQRQQPATAHARHATTSALSCRSRGAAYPVASACEALSTPARPRAAPNEADRGHSSLGSHEVASADSPPAAPATNKARQPARGRPLPPRTVRDTGHRFARRRPSRQRRDERPAPAHRPRRLRARTRCAARPRDSRQRRRPNSPTRCPPLRPKHRPRAATGRRAAERSRAGRGDGTDVRGHRRHHRAGEGMGDRQKRRPVVENHVRARPRGARSASASAINRCDRDVGSAGDPNARRRRARRVRSWARDLRQSGSVRHTRRRASSSACTSSSSRSTAAKSI